jgi:hypothetical protein
VIAGFANANKWPVGFVKWPLSLYRSAALIKVLLERLRRAIRALRVLRSTLTMLATLGAALRISRSTLKAFRFLAGAGRMRDLI